MVTSVTGTKRGSVASTKPARSVWPKMWTCAGDRVARGEHDELAGLTRFDVVTEGGLDEPDSRARFRVLRLLLGDERDLVLVDHQLRQDKVRRVAVALEQLRVVDPDVPARGVDQVGEPTEAAERHGPLDAEVGADELDRLIAPDRHCGGDIVPDHVVIDSCVGSVGLGACARRRR